MWTQGELDDSAPPAAAAAVPAELGAEAPTASSGPPGRERADRTPSRPVRLQIPEIDVATHLVRLGLQPDRTVEVPENADRAGWYDLGAVPGERGAAVILGHVDSVDGPAVFARLGELVAGDAVQVRRASGAVVAFEVRRLVLYDNEEFPAHRVYAASRGRRLSLVTCGGVYDRDRGGYQSNLVVYARRVGPASGPRRHRRTPLGHPGSGGTGESRRRDPR